MVLSRKERRTESIWSIRRMGICASLVGVLHAADIGFWLQQHVHMSFLNEPKLNWHQWTLLPLLPAILLLICGIGVRAVILGLVVICAGTAIANCDVCLNEHKG